MSRNTRLRLEADALYPLLSRFLGAYLHQDWDICSGTLEKAIDRAIAEHPVHLRQQVRRELVSVLERCGDDARLRDLLNDGLGVNLYFRKPAEARSFAEEVERKLLMSIKSHFQERIEGHTE